MPSLMLAAILAGFFSSASAMEVVHFESALPPPSPFKQKQLQSKGIKAEPGYPIWGHLGVPRGEGPFPAVVLMHGCNGIHASHERWSGFLNELGYVTLILDSFSPRSIFSVCNKFSNIASPPIRALDAQGALAYLRSQTYVDANNIGVIGWSHGGMSALAAVSRHGMTSKFSERFKIAAAFYPYCYGDQTADIPVLVLIGSADDWTPLAECRKLEEKSNQEGLPFEMVVYPDAYHAFDDPALENGFTVKGGGGKGHILRFDKSAYADSREQIRMFLETHLGL